MNAKNIKEILISYLKATHHEMRIYQEKSIGSSICDLMTVTDELTGYEIKSDGDNYQRKAETGNENKMQSEKPRENLAAFYPSFAFMP